MNQRRAGRPHVDLARAVLVEALDDDVFPAASRLLAEEAAGAAVTVLAGRNDWVGRKLLVAASGESVGRIGAEVQHGSVRAQQAPQGRELGA